MILTAQPFFNELDLLEIKFRELAGIVDAHVVVEAPMTFTGIPKPLHFAENRERFAEFPVVYAVADLPAIAKSPWDREELQHREVFSVVKALAPEIVLWGDTDEVPRRECVERFRSSGHRTAAMELDSIIFFFDRIDRHHHPSASHIGYFDGKRPWRGEAGHPVLHDAGWHFQFFGGQQHLLAKLLATSHAPEDDGVSDWSMRRGVIEGKMPGMERTTPYDFELLPKFVRENSTGRFKSSFYTPI